LRKAALDLAVLEIFELSALSVQLLHERGSIGFITGHTPDNTKQRWRSFDAEAGFTPPVGDPAGRDRRDRDKLPTTQHKVFHYFVRL
jgi:hypothetical protein